MIVMHRRHTVSLLQVTALLIAGSLAFPGRAAEPRPTMPMQVPDWVKSIGESSASKMDESDQSVGGLSTEAIVPVARPNVGGKVTGNSRAGSRISSPNAANGQSLAEQPGRPEQPSVDPAEANDSFTERAARGGRGLDQDGF